jgi:hypothetical protein
MSASTALIRAVAATAELCGKSYSPAAAAMLVNDLSGFDEGSVMLALTRCRKDGLDARTFNVGAVIARIDDGRPGPEEAWAMLPMSEAQTVVWTDEMIAAWAVAAPLLAEGDRIGARMAFKESYAKQMLLARDEQRPARWRPSIGSDACARDVVLKDAMDKGRLAAPQVQALLSAPMTAKGMALLASHTPKMIENTRISQ